jgi:hypothetical protein
VIALVVLALLQGAASAPAQTYNIAGTLVNRVSGEPLAKARVSVASAETRGLGRTMVTGPDGRFRFEGLPAGKYMLSAERLGFVPQSYMERALYQELATGIAIGEGFSAESLVFRMIPSSVIAGYVTDTRGDPVTGLNVLAMRVVGVGAQRRVLGTFAARTDDRGYYRIRSLAAGRYLVAMYGDASIAAREADPNLAYPVTYFPGATDPGAASPIVLEAGGESRCDTTIRAMTAATLRGDVSFVGARSLLLSISALGPYGSHFDLGRRMSTYHMAKFTIGNLPPGRYAVYLWNDQRIAAYRVLDLNPGDNQVSLGEMQLARVTAKVELRHAGTATGRAVLVLRRAGATDGDSKTLDADGRATFASIAPGQYEVYLTNGQTLAMVSFTARGAAASGSVVEIADTGAVELEIVVDAAAATIGGHAYRGDTPEAGLLVMLVPKVGWENTSTYRFDQSDSDGSFAWQGVAPGDYLTFAFDKGELADYIDAQLVRTLLPKGQPLSVGEGAQPLVKVLLTN